MSGLHDPKSISIQSFRYDLPEELIARKPLAVRDQSKLLVYKNHQITDSRFHQLDNYLNPGDFLIFNQTKVIQARILFQKSSGSTIEIMCLEPHGVTETNLAFQLKGSCEWVALVGNAKRWKEPSLSKTIAHEKGNFELFAEQVERQAGSYIIRFRWNADLSFAEVIEAAGKIPLPPYLNREPDEDDLERYQTVYALEKGSVAAPTAGLHFSMPLVKRLELKGVHFAELTLHVGLGTFRPVEVEDLTKHKMDSEQVIIPKDCCEIVNKAKGAKKRICAVGTTVMRGIETSVSTQGELKPFDGWTNKFIFPPYDFSVANTMITNFHMPESTLLMMVVAFGGYEHVMHAYKVAIKEKYRFYSYGDAMLII